MTTQGQALSGGQRLLPRGPPWTARRIGSLRRDSRHLIERAGGASACSGPRLPAAPSASCGSDSRLTGDTWPQCGAPDGGVDFLALGGRPGCPFAAGVHGGGPRGVPAGGARWINDSQRGAGPPACSTKPILTDRPSEKHALEIIGEMARMRAAPSHTEYDLGMTGLGAPGYLRVDLGILVISPGDPAGMRDNVGAAGEKHAVKSGGFSPTHSTPPAKIPWVRMINWPAGGAPS